MCVKILLYFRNNFVVVPRKRQEKARKNGLEKVCAGQKYERGCAKERAIYAESWESVKARRTENGKSKIFHRTRAGGLEQPFRCLSFFGASFVHYGRNDRYSIGTK